MRDVLCVREPWVLSFAVLCLTFFVVGAFAAWSITRLWYNRPGGRDA